MPIEQMNISLPPKMARFIRGKVKDGQYTNASEVVRDAVRHMQEAEAARNDRALLADFESHLPVSEREDIHRSVRRGIRDTKRAGLRSMTKKVCGGWLRNWSDVLRVPRRNRVPARRRDDGHLQTRPIRAARPAGDIGFLDVRGRRRTGLTGDWWCDRDDHHPVAASSIRSLCQPVRRRR